MGASAGFTRFVSLVLSMGLVLGLGVCAWADQAPKIKLVTTMEKEVKSLKDGKEVIERVPAETTTVGDVLVYTIAYTNEGSDDAVGVKVIDPVPAGTVYEVGSAEGARTDITCSVDGGKSFSVQPVKMSVKTPDGAEIEVDAPAERYTHVKWVVSGKVAPDETGKVSFKVKVK